MKLPGRSFAIALVAIGTAFPACTCGSYEPAPAPATQPTETQAASESAPAASASAKQPRFERIEQKRPIVERVKRLEGLKLDVGAAKAQDGAKAQPANAER